MWRGGHHAPNKKHSACGIAGDGTRVLEKEETPSISSSSSDTTAAAATSSGTATPSVDSIKDGKTLTKVDEGAGELVAPPPASVVVS